MSSRLLNIQEETALRLERLGTALGADDPQSFTKTINYLLNEHDHFKKQKKGGDKKC